MAGEEGSNKRNNMQMTGSGDDGLNRKVENENDLELKLGLSSDGQRSATKKLKSSSSSVVKDLVPIVASGANGEGNGSQACGVALGAHAPPLVRSSSRPACEGHDHHHGQEELKNANAEPAPVLTSQTQAVGAARNGAAAKSLPSVSLDDAGEGEAKTILSRAMSDMPIVSTKGNGPKGRRISGFLYRYKQGEEVKIVCICHGRFLTPAEFVLHGGGTDLEHPMRHIFVNPTLI